MATHGDLEDISTRDEKLLGQVMSRVKGIDFYVIDKFPADLRPFYTMPDPSDATVSNSYDIFIRGEEVPSPSPRYTPLYSPRYTPLYSSCYTS